MKRVIGLFLTLALSVIFLTSCNNKTDVGYQVGNLAPYCELDYVFGEGSDSVFNHRGKVVVINFWGTWCGYCIQELPDFNRLSEEYSDDVVFYMVHSTYGIEDARPYVKDNFRNSKMIFVKDTSTSGVDDDYYSELGGKGSYPRTVILDRSGIVTYENDGAMEYSYLKLLIQSALN